MQVLLQSEIVQVHSFEESQVNKKIIKVDSFELQEPEIPSEAEYFRFDRVTLGAIKLNVGFNLNGFP